MGLRGPLRLAHRIRPPSFPSGPFPPVEFIQINRPGEHHESRCDHLVTLPDTSGEPGSGDGSGAFGSDVIAALSYFAKVVD